MNVVVLDHPRFVNPVRVEDVVNAPLSSCMFAGYVAAMLKSNGHNVELFDANLEALTCKATVERLARLSPDLLAVNLVYMWDETTHVLELLREVKAGLPRCHVTLFGYYPTFAFDFLLHEGHAVDSVIVGEPERTALRLAQNLQAGESWRETRGLAFRSGGGVVRNAPRSLIGDLDQTPFPMRVGRTLREARGICAYVLGSRGCYSNCTFCYLNPFYGFGSHWRGRTPENIIAELRELRSSEGVSYFYFADANFFGPGKKGQERAMRIARLLSTEVSGVQFGLECRANDVHVETMKALRQAGLRDVFLGVESGCDRTLLRMRKHIDAAANARAIKILNDLGIRVSLGFIMFDPDSTLEEVRESFDFLRNNGLLSDSFVTAHVLHHKARALRGTPIFHLVRARADSAEGSFGEYERLYEIADERANLLARKILPVMREILTAAQDAAGAGACLNELAVEFFESSLSLMEQSGASAPFAELESMTAAALAQVGRVRNSQGDRERSRA